jgi:nitrilase
MTTKVAVIQKPPVLLNRSVTIDAVLTSIHEAVGEGASLLVFPKAYIPGYPTCILASEAGGDGDLTNEIYAGLR